MVKIHVYSPASSERCTCCGASLLENGVWYRERQRVCRSCWQWGDLMDAQDAADRAGRRESSAAVLGALGLCLVSAALWAGIGGLVLWLLP